VYKAAICLAILLTGLTASAKAGQLDDAVAAAHRGEYAVAFQLTSPLAEKGDARAQFNIGYMYANGWGVQRDVAEAVKWYRKAAEQGLEVAQHYLGLAYNNGDGIERDDAEAARWFSRAAEQGFSRAQLVLGHMYLHGEGVPKDLVHGYAWVVLAGQRGSPSRTAGSLRLTSEQYFQAQKIVANWKPKLESSLISVAAPRPEEILDPHVGEFADPTTWPASAIGVVAIALDNNTFRCSGALVGPNIVLTAAHCLFPFIRVQSQLINPKAVHFLMGMSKGTPAISGVGEQLIVSKDFVPGNWTPQGSAVDWAFIILKDPIGSKPLPVKALTKEELEAASISGKISQIGYGMERRYSPTVLRNCLADQAEDDRILIVRCLANFGYSGSPILAEVNGTPTVIGVHSAAERETRNAFVCSASQFEEKLKELTDAAISKAVEH
jgi:V8-like Glu-specific endopeptidase